MRMPIVAVLLAGLTLLSPGTARASLGDCTAAGYLERFPDAPTAIDLLCVELFRITVSTPGGPTIIRGVQDISADWAFMPGAAAAVERGARLAADAFAQLGDFRIDDVTLLLLDDAHASFWSGDRPVLAITDGRGSAEAKAECLVTLYMLGDGGDPATLTVTVAHEIFHCLQFATLTPDQMSTVGAGGDWWVEGSAEYFSALAVPESLPSTDRSGTFDEAVDLGIALNGMGHEAAIFFYWLGGEQGPGGLVPFMRKMASDGSAPAQHAVMRGALTDEDWLRFAQDYADGRIAHPQGGALALSPPDGETLGFDENGTQDFPLAPFVVGLGNAEYHCGRWRNTLAPEDANLGTRQADVSGWSAWPAEVDARDAPPARYRVAALHTDSAEAALSIDAERTVSCEPCGGSDRLDTCLVGTWVLSSGGPGEWMREMGVPITAFNSGPQVVRFGDDGTYAAAPFDIDLTTETGDDMAEAEGSAAAAAGRWSAADGTLRICQDSGGVSGTVTVTTRHSTMHGPVSAPGAGELVQSYACSDGSLHTTLPMPGMAPMETEYRRSSEPDAGR